MCSACSAPRAAAGGRRGRRWREATQATRRWVGAGPVMRTARRRARRQNAFPVDGVHVHSRGGLWDLCLGTGAACDDALCVAAGVADGVRDGTACVDNDNAHNQFPSGLCCKPHNETPYHLSPFASPHTHTLARCLFPLAHDFPFHFSSHPHP